MAVTRGSKAPSHLQVLLPFLEAIEVYITRGLVEPPGIMYGDGFLRTSVSNGIHIRMEKGYMRMK
jgi:hypothetical protein